MSMDTIDTVFWFVCHWTVRHSGHVCTPSIDIVNAGSSLAWHFLHVVLANLDGPDGGGEGGDGGGAEDGWGLELADDAVFFLRMAAIIPTMINAINIPIIGIIQSSDCVWVGDDGGVSGQPSESW